MDRIKIPKRVLHIVSAMNRGGAETLLMNVYRNVDKSKLQFDFVSHRNEECDYDDEITSLGGKVFRISSLGQVGAIAYIKELTKIMSDNQYVALHAHTDYQGGFAATAAKMTGIKKRICHSHSNNWPQGSGAKAKVTLKVLQSIIKYAATDYCACSADAARFLFGQGMINNNKVQLLKNGIDISQFTDVDISYSPSVRQELNIPDEAKIIGHIGRFSQSKNHMFILRILKEILKKDMNFIAVLVGDGPLKDSIELEAKKLGIYNNIRFLGVRTDIPRLMRAFDVFLFPSLYEGFGIVMLEAQSLGTPCVVSDTIPKNTDMDLGLVSFISLDEKLETWTREINRALLIERPERNLIIKNFSRLGFDIKNSIPDWLSLYGVKYGNYEE